MSSRTIFAIDGLKPGYHGKEIKLADRFATSETEGFPKLDKGLGSEAVRLSGVRPHSDYFGDDGNAKKRRLTEPNAQ